jgi:mRNA-degrading endonuclease RelE of RelBE toxin-antitoxin system
VAFAVVLHPKAAKELERIESQVRTRIVERLRDLRDNPEAVGKLLRHSDFWNLGVGGYRAICEISRMRKQVIVVFIGHRKKVYDDFSKLL